MTDFPITIVDERLHRKALFHIFSQNEIYSNTYKTYRIMVDFVEFLNSSHPDIDRLHHGYSHTTTQQEHKGVSSLYQRQKFVFKFIKDINFYSSKILLVFFFFHIPYSVLTYYEDIYFAIFFFIIYFIIVYAFILLLCSLLGSYGNLLWKCCEHILT